MTEKYPVFFLPSSQNSMSTELDSGLICGYIVKTYETKSVTSKQKRPWNAKLCQ